MKKFIGKAAKVSGIMIFAIALSIVVVPAIGFGLLASLSSVNVDDDVQVVPIVENAYEASGVTRIQETGLFRIKVVSSKDGEMLSVISDRAYEIGQELELVEVSIDTIDGEPIGFLAVKTLK